MELHLLLASAGLRVTPLVPILPTEIQKIACTLDQAQANTIFVCVCGDHYDSHADAKAAAQKGAVTLGERAEEGVMLCCTDTRAAVGKLFSALYGHPAAGMSWVGVTGTNGKTTVSYLLWQLLKGCRKNAGYIGTLGVCYADQQKQFSYTTPPAKQLWQAIREMKHHAVDAVVMEVSSQGLAQERTAGIRFSLGIFTNLTRDHLDYHHSMEQYFAAKQKLFEQSRAALINLDDPYGQKLVGILPKQLQCYTISQQAGQNVDYLWQLLEKPLSGLDGVSFRLTNQKTGQSEQFHLPLIGKMLALDAAMAIAAAQIAYGVSLHQAALALADCQPVKGRLEKIPVDRPFTVICDYAHTPDALEKLFVTLNQLKKPGGRLIAVYGCGGNRDRGKRPLMAKAGENTDYLILTSDNPREENPIDILEDMKKGLPNDLKCSTIVNRTDAIAFALQMAKKDDIIALCGKGHESYQIIGREKLPFDEPSIVKQLLAGEVSEHDQVKG